METAKVDIRKLQLLNDRINQCIDALSQVRLSVHGLTNAQGGAGLAGGFGQTGGFGQSPIGLSHTGAYGSPFGASPFTQPFGVSPQGPGMSPYGPGMSPYAQVPINPWLPQATQGLSHSTGAWAPAAFAQGVNPFGQGMNPYGGLSPFGNEGLEGYGRTGAADPLLTARIAQTFPYAQFPAPPVISLY